MSDVVSSGRPTRNVRWVAACLVLLLTAATAGCGIAARQAGKKLVPVVAEAIAAAGADAFVKYATARDRDDVVPAGQGGSREGDEVGLYGGSLNESVCDKGQLTAFLTDPANAAQAREWARVLDIPVDEIPSFIRSLTSVTLRFDTLVKNHTFANGKAVPRDSLLPAGMAVLVRPSGVPAVKCNCGNPLVASKVDTDAIKVDIRDPKWKDRYRQDKVRKVKPGKNKVDAFTLTGLNPKDKTSIVRPSGSAGNDDKTGEKIAPEPDLTLTPPEVLPGGGYEATASNFAPGELVRFAEKGGDTLAEARADKTGKATVAITAPGDLEKGKHTIQARGEDSGLTVNATLTVLKSRDSEPSPTSSGTESPGGPRLTLTPTSVAEGGTVTAKATGFEPGEKVVFSRTGDEAAELGSATADNEGAATLRVADKQGPGTYVLAVEGTTSGRAAQATLTVTAASASASASASAGSTPKVTLRPSSVQTGRDFDIVAAGFRPGEDIAFTRAGASPGALGTATADSTGKVTLTESSGEASGAATITAEGLTSGRTATATLRVTSVGAPNVPSESAHAGNSSGSG